MIAILSATEDDLYAMPLPFAVNSWAKIGVRCMVFTPEWGPKLSVAQDWCPVSTRFIQFTAEPKRIPTFSQVIRLFGAAHAPDDDYLITADADICVFGDYFSTFDSERITIAGADLTPEDQYPMCYIGAPVKLWRSVFGITRSSQEHVAELINPIEGSNIRGEQWSFDQWYAKKRITESGETPLIRLRAKPGTQFADRRADRDGWHFDPFNLVDAHLPRPLTDRENFWKVMELFMNQYPKHDHSWMQRYYNEYMKVVNSGSAQNQQ